MDLEDRAADGHEVTDRMAEDEQAAMAAREAGQLPGVQRLDRAGARRPNEEQRLTREASRAACHEPGVWPGALVKRLLERAAALSGHQGGNGNGPHPVQEAIEEEHEQGEAEDHPGCGDAHAHVRHLLGLDLADDAERERQRPDQLRQQELEPAVPVPQPHVARGERPGRHLDAEDRHGHDEAGERRGGPDRCREDGGRRLGRVLPHRQHAACVQPQPGLGDEHPHHAAEQRHDPEAALEVLVGPERDPPGHDR